ncbi:MAG: hypothetical protein ABFE16_01345 [Armatimonadia bacterium]
MTPRYGLATDLGTDDFIEPGHHNRLAETIDRVLGSLVEKVLGRGVFAGWELTSGKQVTAGEGLVGNCWCTTTVNSAISGLTAGALNHVYAVATGYSAPEGTVAFAAQLAPPGPGGSVYLGTMTLDAGGTVTAVDNWASGVERSCCRLQMAKISGSGTATAVPAGSSQSKIVTHSEKAEFIVAGHLVAETSTPDFSVRVTESSRGDQFTLEITNGGTASADCSFTWQREGLLR